MDTKRKIACYTRVATTEQNDLINGIPDDEKYPMFVKAMESIDKQGTTKVLVATMHRIPLAPPEGVEFEAMDGSHRPNQNLVDVFLASASINERE